MNKSIFFDKLGVTNPVTMIPTEGSEGSAIPTYEVKFLDFTDEVIASPETCLRGVAPWDAWLKQSQLMRH